MDWSGIRAEEKVFHNMAVLRELVFYLDLEDILSLLESRVGKFEGVVVGKKAQENLLSYLVNYLAKEDWKNQIPNYGGEAFDRSQRKISVYVKILCFLDCNKEKVLTDLTVKLLQTFPVIRRSWVEDFSFEDQDTQLSRCSDDNRGSIRTTLGGNFTHMSPATFVISKLAENAWTEGGACSRGELLDKTLENVDTENLGDKSRYVGGGCLSETLIGGVLSHLEDSDISFKRLDVTGIHLDSPASIIKFGSLMEKLNKSENSEIGDIDGHIDHLRFSSILCKDDWEAASVSTPAHQSNPRLTKARTKPQLSQASPQPSSEYICIFVYIYKYTYTYIVPICITYTIYVYCSLFSLFPVVF